MAKPKAAPKEKPATYGGQDNQINPNTGMPKGSAGDNFITQEIQNILGSFRGGGWGGFGYNNPNDAIAKGVLAGLQSEGIEYEQRETPGQPGWTLYRKGAPTFNANPPGGGGGGGGGGGSTPSPAGGGGGGTGGGGGGGALLGLQMSGPPTPSQGSQLGGFRSGIGQRQHPPLVSPLAGLQRIY